MSTKIKDDKVYLYRPGINFYITYICNKYVENNYEVLTPYNAFYEPDIYRF
jgi:hypothetical protein